MRLRAKATSRLLVVSRTADMATVAAAAAVSAAASAVGGGEPSQKHLGVKRLAMCPENRLLALAGASGHVLLFKFRRQEASFETTVSFRVFFLYRGKCIYNDPNPS